ncbi:MAG TPA: hypothetical protein VGP71_00235 [Burkholderiales bacterium]|nr:hypothetical protein [Burkholderiales bacterium]
MGCGGLERVLRAVHERAPQRDHASTAFFVVSQVPLGIYNFTEAMNNVESASAAGDNYNLRKILLADGLGAILGSMLGSPFPPAVYIGHPGWKSVGGRIGYSLAMAAFIIDKQLNRAAVAAFAGAVLAWIGLIHAGQLGWGAAPGVALGYALFGVVCLVAGLQQKQASS